MHNDHTKSDTRFEISCTKVNDKNILTIMPVVKNEGYDSVSIEISNEQWDALRYHFVSAINDRLKITKLAYIYSTR